jgi:hypothetical protein
MNNDELWGTIWNIYKRRRGFYLVWSGITIISLNFFSFDFDSNLP